MKPIKPVKVVRSAKSQDVSAKPPSNLDNAESRSNYDPRLMNEHPLVEEYKHYPLMTFFSLSMDERQSEEINNRIKAVYTWVDRRFPNADKQTMFKALRILEQEIGLPQMGDTRLNNLYGYISIENQIDELESERQNRYGR